MLFTYPAIIHNDEDGLWLEFVDFNCHTHADSLNDLLFNAKEAMECHLLGLMECGVKLPETTIDFEHIGYTYIQTDIDLAKNTKSVKKNCTIPSWLNEQAERKHLNFSKILQEALIANLAHGI